MSSLSSIKDEPEYFCGGCGRECYERLLPMGWYDVEEVTVDVFGDTHRTLTLLCPDCGRKEKVKRDRSS